VKRLSTGQLTDIATRNLHDDVDDQPLTFFRCYLDDKYLYLKIAYFKIWFTTYKKILRKNITKIEQYSLEEAKRDVDSGVYMCAPSGFSGPGLSIDFFINCVEDRTHLRWCIKIEWIGEKDKEEGIIFFCGKPEEGTIGAESAYSEFVEILNKQ